MTEHQTSALLSAEERARIRSDWHEHNDVDARDIDRLLDHADAADARIAALTELVREVANPENWYSGEWQSLYPVMERARALLAADGEHALTAAQQPDGGGVVLKDDSLAEIVRYYEPLMQSLNRQEMARAMDTWQVARELQRCRAAIREFLDSAATHGLHNLPEVVTLPLAACLPPDERGG